MRNNQKSVMTELASPGRVTEILKPHKKAAAAGLNAWQWGLAVLVFLCCLAGASLLRVEYCPDEWARRLLCDYMVQHGRLPIGEEGELILREYGFSYAIYPYLAAMINALFMRIAGLFTGSERVLLAASRMCSVLSLSVGCVYLQRIGNALFRRRCVSTLFAALVCFMPQTMFLGMYHNNDSLALCGVIAVLYSVLMGSRNHWRVRDCVHLTVWTSATLLSYYNAYGWLLVCGIVTAVSFLSDKRISGKEKALKMTGIFLGIVALAGWWFIRNAYYHNGDFLGMTTEAVDRARLEAEGWVFKNYRRPSEMEGYTLFRMLTEERCAYLVALLKSFIGAFGNMNIFMPGWIYFFYYAVILLGAVCFGVFVFRKKTREEKWILGIFLAGGIITVGLTLYNSYFTDYQPQGRYIITLLLPLAFGITDTGTALLSGSRSRDTILQDTGTYLLSDDQADEKPDTLSAGKASMDMTRGKAERSGQHDRRELTFTEERLVRHRLLSRVCLGFSLLWIGMFFVVFLTTMRQMIGP